MKSRTKEGNVISLDESMATCLLYFEDAVRSMAKPTEELFADFDGHPGVAWELRQEILAGKPLVQWDQISSEVNAMIYEVVIAVEEMPIDAYAGNGIEDLRRPAWFELRKLALAFAHRSQR